MAAYTTIDDPSAYFKVQLYTGDGSTPSITFDDTDTDMQPDLVWIKNRDQTDSHCLFDAVRGVTEVLHSDAATAEVTDADTLTSFDSDGFALGADVKVNTDTEKYVAWNWKAGTTSGIAGSPSITPLGYSFNATSGFSIIKYNGNYTSGATLPHGLGVAPKMMIVKNLDTGVSWGVYHKSIGATDYLYLDTNIAAYTASTRWNDTEPGAQLFTIGNTDIVNTDADDYIAYCFADVQGFSKFGSYTGNGNADGTFIYTGFRPAWAMFKKYDSGSADWEIMDNKRAGYNDATYKLVANETNTENTDTGRLEILSNGFKIRTTGTGLNTSGGTYIYAAFAEAPFVNSNGVPCNAR